MIRLDPFGVKHTRLINALVSVRAKKVALRLQQIGWEPRLTVTIEVSQRGTESRNGNAMQHRCRNCDAPIVLRPFDNIGEIPIEQEIGQRRVALIRLDNAIEKFGANDASAPPDRGNVAEVEVPLVFSARCSEELHSLRVGNNLGCIKRVTHCIDKVRPIAFKLFNFWLRKNF